MKLQELRNYLISSCRYVQTEAGVDCPEATAIWVEWIVARSLCVFRSVDIGGVDRGDLDALLRLQVREWAPFADPEFHFEVQGSRALIWAWDGVLRRQCCGELSVTPDAILPETLVRCLSPEEDETLVLSHCWEGVEARGFLDGQLAVSRWWPQLPSQQSWNQLRMLFDLEPVPELPGPVNAPLPAGQGATLRSMLLPFLKSESTLFVLLFCLFIAAGSFQLSGILYADVAAARAEARIEELNGAVTPVLVARDVALDALDSIESISELHSGPLQLQYLADLLARLALERDAGRQVELLAWEYSGGNLAISVAGESLSATELLGVFESIPWLLEPRLGDDVVKGRMKISAQLQPDWRFETTDVAGLADS
ncbi:MAG: hypothetical protein ABJ308_16845 [Halieaceae bacterium]